MQPAPREPSIWVRRIPWPSRRSEYGRCLLALLALLLALFPGVVLRGEVFYQRDVLLVWVPQVESFVRAIHAGSWPVWDPWVAFGQPLLGNPNTQVFYPFTWLNLLVPPLPLYVAYALAHLLLAGLGFYLWARRLELSEASATLAALVWVGSGPLLSLVNVWHHLAGAAWLPWVLWVAHRALGEGRRRDLLVLGVLLAVQVSGGSPDLCVLTGLVLGVDVLRRMCWRARAWEVPLRLLTAYGVALALSAAQLVPSLVLALRSGRASLSGEARTVWSMHPAALAQILVPLSFEDLPRRASSPGVGALFELWSPFMASTYLGLAAAFLVVWGLWSGRGSRWFPVFVFAGALGVALGRHSFVYGVLAALVPPLRMIRYPSKALIVAALAWALLVGVGFEALRRGRGPGRAGRSAIAALFCGLAVALALAAHGTGFFPFTLPLAQGGPPWARVFSLNGPAVTLAAGIAASASLLGGFPAERRASWPALVLALLVVADLGLANRRINPTEAAQRLNRAPEILRSMPHEPDARVYVWDYVLRAPGRGHPVAGMLGLFRDLPADPSDAAAETLAMQAYLYPPSAARFGLHGSYDRDLLGLFPPWLNEMNLLLRGVEDTPAFTNLLQIGGVQRVVALHRDHPSLRLLAEIPGVFRRPIQVFEVPDPWPRTYAVCRARTAPGVAALRALIDPGFDPNREAIVDGPVALGPGACRRAESRIVEDRPDRIVIDADLDGTGIVVLLDGADSGWVGFVDSAEEPVLRVNQAFRGLEVPAGRHRLTLVYRPASIAWGLAISGLSILAVAVALVRSRIPEPA